MEAPLGPLVLLQVDPLLLAQLAHLIVELPGDVGVGGRDCPGNALGSKEAVDLGGGCEDVVGGASAQDQLHVGLRQVEVARRQEDGGVRPSVGQQALWVEERVEANVCERKLPETSSSSFNPADYLLSKPGFRLDLERWKAELVDPERGGAELTCVTCSSTWIPRGFIWTSGSTQVSSSPPPSSSSSASCLAWAALSTDVIRLRATAENSCRSPVVTGESKR